MSRQSDYFGRKVALLTQHGKERVIAPILEPGVGCCWQPKHAPTPVGCDDPEAVGSLHNGFWLRTAG